MAVYWHYDPICRRHFPSANEPPVTCTACGAETRALAVGDVISGGEGRPDMEVAAIDSTGAVLTQQVGTRARPLTWADFKMGAVTLKELYRRCGGEAEAWEAYFAGGFDADIQAMFEGCIRPEARQVAVMLRAFLKQVKGAK